MSLTLCPAQSEVRVLDTPTSVSLGSSLVVGTGAVDGWDFMG
jgi:hypothetical protein